VGGWVGRERGREVDTTIMMMILFVMHALDSSTVVMHALESLDIDIEIISRMIVAYFFILMYAIREILGF
jgi:hypothetical protein